MRYLLLLITLIATPAQSLEFLKARDLSLGIAKYGEGSRDLYLMTPETGQLKAKLDLTWNTDILKADNFSLYWDNQIHSKASEARFRHVGWEYETGLDLGKIQIFHWHYSQHMMEQIRLDNKEYPVEDTYGIRLHFLRSYK